MMKRRMWSLAFGLVCAGMTLSVSGHAGWAPQRPQAVASMSALDLPAFKKPITKRFVNAKLSEVLAWLSLEKFSFVADVSEFPEQGQVTLNFQQQPLGAVLDAISDAFHGRWERRGDIFTLRSGRSIPAQTVFERALEAPVALPAPGNRISGTIAPTVLMPRAERTRSVGTTIAPPTGQTCPPSGVVAAPLTTAQSPSKLLAPRALAEPGLALPPEGISALTRSLVSPQKAFADVAPLTRTLAAPRIEGIRSLSVPAIVETQDPKSQEEAMRAAERAMKEAEAAIRKLHESGEWRRAMEKAMAEGQGQRSEEMRKAMEEVHKAMRELHNSKEWKEAWAKAREEIRQALKSGKVTDGGKTRAMTEKERQTLEKTLKKFETSPEFKFDFKDLPKMDQKMFEKMKLDEKTFVMPKMDQKMFEKMKLDEKVWAMPKMDPKAFEKLKDFEGKVWAMPEMDKKAFEKMMKDHKSFVMPKIEGKNWVFTMPGLMGEGDREAQIQKRIQEMRQRSGVKSDPLFKFGGTTLRGVEGVRPFMIDSKRMRIKELLESLTPAQKEKQEKQGYLNLDDLTPKQREMLGDIPKEGNWTFSYSIDGKKVTIKGK